MIVSYAMDLRLRSLLRHASQQSHYHRQDQVYRLSRMRLGLDRSNVLIHVGIHFDLADLPIENGIARMPNQTAFHSPFEFGRGLVSVMMF